MKKLFYFLMLLLPFSLFGGGGGEEVVKEVEGLENWHSEIDLTEYADDSEYNLLVRAMDKAGNEGISGPYTIVVDYESDIPTTQIKSPSVDMRTTGKLNILGTAIDDDGVAYVEVRLGEEGEIFRADGTQYWSFFMDLTEFTDGDYEIQARSTDINGLTNEVWTIVPFNLDQFAPKHTITNNEMGALVTGNMRLEGFIEEHNGIERVQWALAPDLNWRDISYSYIQEEDRYQFALDQNTRDLEDGPHVIWLRSTNNLGVRGETPYLFFSDNTAPLITVLKPTEEEQSLGNVSFVGMVEDAIGVESLNYWVDEEINGDILLEPGNPFWSLDLDFSGIQNRDRRIRFTAQDATGNQGVNEWRFFLDYEADRPVVELIHPATRATYQEMIPVRGWINDDDRVTALYYQQGDSEPIRIETDGAFSFELPPQSAGNQRVIFWAEDENGLLSVEVPVEFTFVPPAPVLTLDSAVSDGSTEVFYPGYLFEGSGEDQGIQSTIETVANVQSIVYEVSGQEPRNLSATRVEGTGEYNVLLPVTSEYGLGRHFFTVTVTDNFGSSTTKEGFYLILSNDLAVDGGQDPDFVADSKDYFHFQDNRIGEDGRIVLESGKPLQGLFYLESELNIQEISLSPETDLLTIDSRPVDSGAYLISISMAGEGASEPTAIRVSATDGTNFLSSPLTYVTDLSPPIIDVITPQVGQWIDRELEVSLSLQESGIITDLSYMVVFQDIEIQAFFPDEETREAQIDQMPGNFSDMMALLYEEEEDEEDSGTNLTYLQGGQSVPVPDDLATGESVVRSDEAIPSDGRPLSFRIPLDDLPDGNLTLFVRATDAGGMKRTLTLPFFKDTVKPEIRMITPPEEMAIDGLTTIVFDNSEKHMPIGAEYSYDGETFNPIDPGKTFQTDIDFSSFEELPQFVFRTTDRSGNMGELTPEFLVDKEKDKPQVSIQVPAEGEVLRSDFFISGLVTDDDAVAEIFFRIDEEEFRSLDGINSFNYPVSLSSISDAPHTVEIYAVDINGTESEIMRRNFIVSSAGPVSQLLTPDLNNTQTGKITLQGISEDPNGVERVWVSLDNGTTYALMEGAEAWNYEFDTTILADGLYSILVRAEDTTGAFGDYNLIFFVDNTPPTISLVNPKDGNEYTSFFQLEGRGDDNLDLDSLRYRLRSLDSREAAMEGSLPQEGGFTQVQDVTGLTPGWYNFEVEAIDNAGNITYVARNIQIRESIQSDSLDIFFPAEGQRVSGPVEIEGRFKTQSPDSRISLYVNGEIYTTFETSEDGYFNKFLDISDMNELISEKTKEQEVYETMYFHLQVEREDGTILESPVRRIEYTHQGPWLTVDSHQIGDMITQRPFFIGRVGYYGVENIMGPVEPQLDENGDPIDNIEPDKALFGPRRRLLRDIHNTAPLVKISRDNGLTFQDAVVSRVDNPDNLPELDGVYQFSYRMETLDYPQGDLNLLVRAEYADGSVLTTRQILTVDKQVPIVTLVQPTEGGSFNQTMELIGAASDNFGLESVEALMWQGFKREYQTSGLSGVYVESAFLGAQGFFQGAVGGSALDGMARIQLGVSRAPDASRFNGYVYSAKLLLNLLGWRVSEFPIFSTLFPVLRNFDWMAISGGLGADFSYFTMNTDPTNFWTGEDPSVMVPGFISQFELKFITNLPSIESLSAFYELGFYFISSDVDPIIFPVWTHFGFRWQIF